MFARSCGGGEDVVRFDRLGALTGGADRSHLDRVLELAHVARPIGRLDGAHGRAVQTAGDRAGWVLERR